MTSTSVNNVPGLIQHVPINVQPYMQEKPKLETVSTQTPSLKKAVLVHTNLNNIIVKIYQDFPHLQTRVFTYGPQNSTQSIEISRVKADIPQERGGPLCVTFIRVLDTGKAELCVAGDVILTTQIFSSKETEEPSWDVLKEILQKLDHNYVFC
jgi:hypothetical protein